MRCGRELVVVLCDTYDEAEEAYYIFKDWMCRHESWLMSECCDNDNGLLTNDGFAYIFIDAQIVDWFLGITDDIVYVQEFFDEIMTDEDNERSAFEYWRRKRKASRHYVLAE